MNAPLSLKSLPGGEPTSGRVPPASVTTEQTAIGIVLMREEIPPDLGELVADDFYLPAHRDIWDAIRAMAKADKRIDVVALGDEMRVRNTLPRLQDGEGYLLVCAEGVIHAENAGHYARLIREKAALRRMIHLCSSVMSRSYDGVDLEAILSEARNGVADLEMVGGGQGPVLAGDEMGNVIETIERRAEHPELYAVLTGLVRFDRHIGGLQPEKLIVVAAPPGMGKTAWAGTVAINAATNGVPSLIVSVEMGRQEVFERFIAGKARVSTKAIGTGDVVRDRATWSQKVLPAASTIASLPVWVDDRESLTIGAAVGTIRRWYQKTLGSVPPKDRPPRPAFVAIDYLQLLSSDDERDDEDRNKAIGRMTRACKRLAKSLRIPIVLLSQLSRAWTKRGGKPVLSDLRDSGAIEQDADVVIFPWREPPKTDEGNEIRNTSGEAEWIVAKNRGGPTGKILCYWHAEYTRFENLDPTDADPRLPFKD